MPTTDLFPTVLPDRVVAPGYMWMSGTSFAAPIVAGAAAQILARHPGWAATASSNANWSSANWSSANWSSANWSSANWSSANSCSANWGSANWSSANWSSANWAAAAHPE